MISGLHKLISKDMLEILLNRDRPVVICPARRLEEMRISPTIDRAIHAGRVLLLSIYNEKGRRIIMDHCEARNNLVAALASRIYFIHYDPGGSLSFLYSRIEVSEKLV